MFSVSNVWDSTNLCCALSCPAGSGLNTNLNPFSCTQCNSSNGQTYNSTTNQCECMSGYYLVSSISQTCSQCTGALCASCYSSTPWQCTSCVTNAQLNSFYANCSCLPGFTPTPNGQQCTGCPSGTVLINGVCSNCPVGTTYNNGQCTGCGYRCTTCSNNVCLTCVDPTRRNISTNCGCIDGYFDNNQAACVACSSICQTCSALNVCTSCYSSQSMTLSNGQCVCSQGFYSTINNQGNLVCKQCDAICNSCSVYSWNCDSCNTSQNKVPASVTGYDPTTYKKCLCASGYTLSTNGTCSLMDCTSDIYCSNCQSSGSQKICLSCKTGTNRVLDPNTYRCVCNTSYY
jgi:hypothetical protein